MDSNKDEEDREFSKRTDESLARIEAVDCITMDFDNFLEEMEKW